MNYMKRLLVIVSQSLQVNLSSSLILVVSLVVVDSVVVVAAAADSVEMY